MTIFVKSRKSINGIVAIIKSTETTDEDIQSIIWKLKKSQTPTLDDLESVLPNDCVMERLDDKEVEFVLM